jgi:hypothetical protein
VQFWFFSGDGMLKTLIRIGTAATVLSIASIAHSQAMPTATGHGGGIQVGGAASMGKPDFGSHWLAGISIFADYNIWSRVGLEANAHILNMHTPDDLGENTYEAGPRFYWRKKRYTMYAKAQLGVGNFLVQEIEDNPGKSTASSFMYSIGGGVDVDFPHHITLRAFDFEYQEWPGFRNDGLTPAMGSVGLAYRFH